MLDPARKVNFNLTGLLPSGYHSFS